MGRQPIAEATKFYLDICFLCKLLAVPDSKVHGAHLGLTGPRWAPCWPHKPCYLGCYSWVHCGFVGLGGRGHIGVFIIHVFVCLENSKFLFLFHTISLGQNDAGSSNPHSWTRRSCFSYIVSSLAADVLAKQESGHRQPWCWSGSYGVFRNKHFKCTASGWNRVISL